MSTTHYDVIERIAVGGMAEIYLGIARGLEGFSRPVVIKKVRPRLSNDQRFVQMLIKEAKITAALSHPNIVQILDLGRNAEDEHFIVMEYVDGQDLRSLIDEAAAKGLAIGRELAVFVASEVCAALDHAHRQTDEAGRPLNLIHRDVSPSNVLVSFAGEVKLTDFGIARYGRDVSVIGTLKGKLAYMSPEQARGNTVDHRSDLYSLGSILFEIVLGRRVHLAETDLEMLEQVREGQVPLPSSIAPEIPLELERIMLRALAPTPSQRFQSAEEMGSALRAHLFRSTQPSGPKALASLLKELFPLRRSTSSPDGAKFHVTGAIGGFQSIVEDPDELSGEPGSDFVQEQSTTVSAPPENLLHRMRSREELDRGERTPVVEVELDRRAEAPARRAGPIQELATNRAFFGSGSEAEVLRIITSIPSLDDLEPITDDEIVAPAARHEVIERESSGEIVELETRVSPLTRGHTTDVQRVPTEETSLQGLEVELPAGAPPPPREASAPHPREAARRAAEPPPRAAAPRHAPAPSRPAPPERPADPTGPRVLPRGSRPDPTDRDEVPPELPTAPRRAAPDHDDRAIEPLVPPEPSTLPRRSPVLETRDALEPPTLPHRAKPREAPLAGPPLKARPLEARPRRLMPVLAVSLLGLGLGSAAAWLYLRTSGVRTISRSDAPRPDPRRSRTIDASPPAAVADGRAHDGTAPSRPGSDLRGRSRIPADAAHTRVVLQPKPVRPVLPKPVRPVVPKLVRPAQRASGQLVIKSEPWAYIHVDGRNTRRTTSATAFALPAGTHRIELVNPELKLRTSFTVTIAAGETLRKFVRLE
jgi:serine/threonine protein kinase